MLQAIQSEGDPTMPKSAATKPWLITLAATTTALGAPTAVLAQEPRSRKSS